jgi:hypothetical protein
MASSAADRIKLEVVPMAIPETADKTKIHADSGLAALRAQSPEWPSIKSSMGGVGIVSCSH